MCVCVCLYLSERERERETVTSQQSVQRIRNRLNHGLFANTYEHNHCVCHATLFPFRLELIVKLKTLLTVFTFILKDEACDYGQARYISDAACGVQPITMHCASWPIRADCACRKEGLCKHLREAGHRGSTIM